MSDPPKSDRSAPGAPADASASASADEWKTKAELIAELNALRARFTSLTADESPRDAVLFGTSEAANEGMLETASRAIVGEIDDEGRLRFLSNSVREVLGRDPKFFIGKSIFDWFEDDTRRQALDRFLAIMRAGVTTRAIYRARGRDDEPLWLESVSSPFQAEDGSLRTIVVTHDVTALKVAGDELREGEDRYRAIAENASDLIAEVDGEGRILFVSANSEAILGVAADELVGVALPEIDRIAEIHPDDRPRVEKVVREALAGDRPDMQVALRYRRDEGAWRWLIVKAQLYSRRGGALRASVIARDVTERTHNRIKLHQSEERYRVVAQASGDVITEIDAEGRLVYVSETVTDVLGYQPEKLIGTTPFMLLHPDDVVRVSDDFLAAVENDEPARSQPFRIRHAEGHYVWMVGTSIPYRSDPDGEVNFIGVSRDISAVLLAERERRELEARMLRAQKLEGLGVLAGGVAHDFNNLLTPILGDASLALVELPEDSPVRARLHRIQKASHRAAALTNQMLAYAGAGPLVSQPVDLSELVEEMGQLLESAVVGQAKIHFDLLPDLPCVQGDGAQLSQIVMNLITNAAEALGPEGGRITLRTGLTDASQIEPFLPLPDDEVPKGAYAYFEVVDTGRGMNEQIRTRIFDPFFTTKFTGRGLGLAAVLGIVRGHKGVVEIESAPDEGTRFRVLFPASQLEAPRPASSDDEGLDWPGSGCVLVIDDDEGVRDLTADTLHRCGLSVLTARDGAEGVEVFRDHAADIDLVLLDRTMPGMGGAEVFDRIRAIRDDARVVLVSGYTEERAAADFADGGLSGFLQKPFAPETLVATARRILEDEAPD